VVATPEAALVAEAELFEAFLGDVAASSLAAAEGAVFLASSAGGVYAGSPSAAPFTETSPTGSLVPYGHAKLRMEAALAAHVDRTGSAALVARIANLYGPGQDLTKPQGLVSQLCRTALTGQPLVVYVPLDTMRDYVFAEDCADLVVTGLMGLRDRVRGGAPRVVTKVVASGQSVTIGALVAETARQYKRRPHVVVKAPVEGTGQVVDLRLRSTVWTELDAALRTTTAVGFLRTASDVGEQLRSPGRGLGHNAPDR
jgi:UDP-glucose 4-epimerase